MKYILQIYSSIHGVPGQVLGVAVNFSRKPGQAAAGVAMVEFLCLATLRVYALGTGKEKKKRSKEITKIHASRENLQLIQERKTAKENKTVRWSDGLVGCMQRGKQPHYRNRHADK